MDLALSVTVTVRHAQHGAAGHKQNPPAILCLFLPNLPAELPEMLDSTMGMAAEPDGSWQAGTAP